MSLRPSIVFPARPSLSPSGLYSLEFRNVSFVYPDTEAWILKDVSVGMAKGDLIALSGANGSGKSTFIKLVCRLYDPTEGRILLNGQDLSGYTREELQQLLSVQFQDSSVFPFSLRENIAFSKIDRREDDEWMRHCSSISGIDRVAKNLSDGYETCLSRMFNNGAALSGGQIQRIAITRALFADTPLFVFDEPTANVDTDYKKAFIDYIHEKAESGIIIVATHDPEILHAADRVLHFEDQTVSTYSSLDQSDLRSRLEEALREGSMT